MKNASQCPKRHLQINNLKAKDLIYHHKRLKKSSKCLACTLEEWPVNRYPLVFNKLVKGFNFHECNYYYKPKVFLLHLYLLFCVLFMLYGKVDHLNVSLTINQIKLPFLLSAATTTEALLLKHTQQVEYWILMCNDTWTERTMLY